MKRTKLLLILLFTTAVWSLGYGQQQNKYPRGVLEGDDKLYRQMPKKTALTRTFYSNLPRRVSIKKYAPTPRSQGKYGTCTGWAVAYAARTILEAQQNKWTNINTINEHAFSPAFQYRMGNPYAPYCNGAFTSEVIKSLQTVGSVPMQTFFVEDDKELCPSVPMPLINKDRAKTYKIEGYAALWKSKTAEGDKEKMVKTSLSEGNPVVISMKCPDSFDNVPSTGLWRPTEVPSNVTGSHAMCVVGYDDYKFGGAFEVMNSWGDNWGNNGFCWIKYNDFRRFTYQAYELLQLPAPANEEPLLAGSLRIQNLSNGTNLNVRLEPVSSASYQKVSSMYKVAQSLTAGTKIRLYLKSKTPAYAYMLGTGTVDQSISDFFPLEGVSPALNYHSSEIAFPSERHYLEMDNTAEKSYIIVIFSKRPLDITQIKRRMSNSFGSIMQRVNLSLRDYLASKEHIHLNQQSISFNVSQKAENKAFAMIVEFD